MATENAADRTVSKELGSSVPEHAPSLDEKQDFSTKEKHFENSPEEAKNLSYNDDEEEPEIHLRTWVALGAMWLLNYVQVVALQGPPAVVSHKIPAGSLMLFNETNVN
jgi:hypothetical protein